MNKKLFLTLSFFITLTGFGFQNTQAMNEVEEPRPETNFPIKSLQELRDGLISERESQKEEQTISTIIKRKIPQNLEISGDDLGIKAVYKIIDQETRESILTIYNASYANAKLLIDWLIFEVSNPEEMLNYWEGLPFEKRPIIQIPDSWKAEQEVTKIEDLENGLKNDWQGQPLIISGDNHVVAITGQRNDEEKKFTVSFYDAYEPFGEESSSYLEMAILCNFLYKHFPTYEANVIPYYTKHQKLTTFGECRLFADVYYNCLSKGEKPECLSEDVVLQEVEEMKIKMRQDDPDYFHKYDTIFQYIFDSGYAQVLLNDIMDHKKTLKS